MSTFLARDSKKWKQKNQWNDWKKHLDIKNSAKENPKKSEHE